MSEITFYAWTAPAFVSGSPVDHTWVTTYDNRENTYPNDQAVADAGESYWYCWGDFHAQGGTTVYPDGLLGSQPGILLHAQCLVTANADSREVAAARGTIFTYGVDGVCHQLANQVLYATGVGGNPSLTVNNARGYRASTFLYGTYGLQHSAWENKVNSCSTRVTAIGVSPAMSVTPDEFEQHVRDVIGPANEELVQKLLALRDEAQAQRADVLIFRSNEPVTAETLNERNQKMLDNAAKLLGDELFTRVFGFSPSEKINLVDPEIFRNAKP